MAWSVGRWIDRGHERAVMTGGSLVIAAGLLLHSFVTSAAGFYAVWLLLGAGLSATLYNPAFSIVTRRFPNDFRRAIITLTLSGRSGEHRLHSAGLHELIAQLGWRHARVVLRRVAHLDAAADVVLEVVEHRQQLRARRLRAGAAQRFDHHLGGDEAFEQRGRQLDVALGLGEIRAPP